MVLWEEVELDEVTRLGDDVLGLEVQTIVGGGGAGKDAVDDAGGTDLELGRCGSAESEEGGCCESDICEADHLDGVCEVIQVY